ncbi:MAG: MFS transporter [Bacteroides sp.]|nr:MFS transporter [Bacteroides sp.]
MNNSPQLTAKGFSRAFWVSNTVELFERMAYYAVFIVLTIYLSTILGFNDLEASMISGLFSGGLYLLPIFTGAYADKIGFRKSMLTAFSLLTIGYLGLGILPTLLESTGLVSYGETTTFSGIQESSNRWIIVPILLTIVVGGSFIKSVISASVAKETTEANRARGYSIFYMMVNIGAFTGKTVIDPLRGVIGEEAYIYINYFAAAMTFIALIAVYLLYKSAHTAGQGKSMKEIAQGFVRVLSNWRLLTLILIITGFWMVQHQLYATMPKYVIRMAGEAARPGWIANVNPFVVVCCVGFITRLMAKRTAITSMSVGMFLIPFSALLMATGNMLGNEVITGMSNITMMMIAGIIVQGLAECFISPRYLEYFSLQAPKGEEGLYLGFSHLHSFLSSIFGFGLAGYLLTKYCPDPTLFETHEAWEAASVNAHYIWFYFAAIGVVAAIALVIFGRITRYLDKKKEIQA